MPQLLSWDFNHEDSPLGMKCETTEKSYECPHCDFVATGSNNMKIYEDAVKHKNSSHKDVEKIGENIVKGRT